MNEGLSFARFSLFCRDLEASLRFYRDLLGMVVVEQKEIEGAAAGGLLQLPPCKMRIVYLAPDADAPMIVGLFELSGTPVDEVRPPEGRPHFGQASLVLHTLAFHEVHARLVAAGVHFLTPPVRYPKHTTHPRTPPGIYNEMIFYDPDGSLVSVMQIEPLPAG